MTPLSQFRSLLILDIFPENDLTNFIRIRPGGIVVRRRHTQSPAQVKELIQKHQRSSKIPLLVAANFEWGVGNDVRGSQSLFPGTLALSAACGGGNYRRVYEQARAIGREARALGVNTIFGPMIDVILSEAATDGGTRAFSQNPKEVARFGREYVRGLRDSGVASTCKHFPGVESGGVDPHLSFASGSQDLRALARTGLVSFSAAMDRNHGGVMMGHMAFPKIDPKGLPSTLSATMTRILRDRLKFKGFIITDNMAMGAVAKHFPPEELFLGPLRAGADLILIHTDKATRETLAACERKIARDPALQVKISTAYNRMKEFRKRWKMGQAWGDPARLSAQSRAVAQKISEGAIATLRDPRKLLPVTDVKYRRTLVICPQAADGFHVALKSNFGYFAAEFKRHAPDAEIIFFSDRPGTVEIRGILNRSAGADVIIALLHEEPGTHGVAAEKMTLFGKLLSRFGNKTVVAGMVSPLFLKPLPKKGAAIFSFSAMPTSQTALARAVAGILKPVGRIPVRA